MRQLKARKQYAQRSLLTMNQSDEVSIDERSLCTEDQGGNESRALSEEENLIGKRETAVVTRLRLVLFFVLAVSAVGVASTVYVYLKTIEESAFQTQFDDDAIKILQTVANTIESILSASDNLAVLSVSFARATNQTWPFVTLPDFPVRIAKIMPSTRTFNMNILPLVTPARRIEWEAYVLQHDDWVNETADVQRDFKNFNGVHEYDTMPHNIIHGDFDNIPYNETYVFIPFLKTRRATPEKLTPGISSLARQTHLSPSLAELSIDNKLAVYL
jgi:hypothetical protein